MHIEIMELVTNATSEARETPDVALNIEISDRINGSEAEYRFSRLNNMRPSRRCRAAVKKLIEILGSRKTRRVLLALDVREMD